MRDGVLTRQLADSPKSATAPNAEMLYLTQKYNTTYINELKEFQETKKNSVTTNDFRTDRNKA